MFCLPNRKLMVPSMGLERVDKPGIKILEKALILIVKVTLLAYLSL